MATLTLGTIVECISPFFSNFYIGGTPMLWNPWRPASSLFSWRTSAIRVYAGMIATPLGGGGACGKQQ